MLGAIIGDIAGSMYEVTEFKTRNNKQEINYEQRIKILNKNTPLFTDECSYTDDTVLSTAICDAVINGAKLTSEFEQYLKQYGLKEIDLGKDKYGRNRFGVGFTNWLLGSKFVNSYGNGCAMRISSIPMYFDDLEEIKTVQIMQLIQPMLIKNQSKQLMQYALRYIMPSNINQRIL